MNDRLKAIIEGLMAEEFARFKAENPGCMAWDDEVKLVRFGLWLQERYVDSPEDQRRLEEDRAMARRHLLLE
jgi:hypothetical protein